MGIKKHYFITSHFNYNSYKSRNRLTTEFLERYPNVLVLEGSYNNEFLFKGERYNLSGAGWATCYMLNNFIKENRDTIESLTFIDADVILWPEFFENIVKEHERNASKPFYLQPYSSVNKREEEGSVNSLLYEIVTNDCYSSYFHTGYVYSYNRKLLNILNVFPESLVLGGYDTVLYYSLLKLSGPFKQLILTIDNDAVVKELVAFYNKFILNSVSYGFLNGHITTFEHGRMINRKYNSRMGLYKNLSLKVVEDYFSYRNEDNEF